MTTNLIGSYCAVPGPNGLRRGIVRAIWLFEGRLALGIVFPDGSTAEKYFENVKILN